MYEIIKDAIPKAMHISEIIKILVSFLPTFTMKEAKEHREQLMFDRQFYIDDVNNKLYERKVSFCEH